MIGVAIDPGVHHCGVAIFQDGELAHAQLTTGLGGQAHPLLEPIPHVVEMVADLVDGEELLYGLVIEVPKVYRSEHQKGDQRDLINLAVVVGALAQALSQYFEGILIIEPSVWKGQQKKHHTEKRVLEELTKEELERVQLPSAKSIQHNIFDAIGIGLWRWRK